MSDRESAFVVTIPAGTPKVAPTTTALKWVDGILRRLHVTIPSGHAGLTGYQFAYDGQQMVPNNTGAFVVDNDAKIDHDINVVMVGGRWQFVAYNTDVYDHSFYLRAEIDELADKAPSAQLPINVTATPALDQLAGEPAAFDDTTLTAPADVPTEPTPEVAP